MQAAHSPIYFLTLLFFYFFIFFPAWGWRGLEHHPLTPILFYFFKPVGEGQPRCCEGGEGAAASSAPAQGIPQAPAEDGLRPEGGKRLGNLWQPLPGPASPPRAAIPSRVLPPKWGTGLGALRHLSPHGPSVIFLCTDFLF